MTEKTRTPVPRGPEVEVGVDGDVTSSRRRPDMLYSVDDVPPWYLTILLGFQHYLTALNGIISVPLILAPYLCMDEDYVGLSELIGTVLFISGLITFLQSTFGVRLPIVQGATFTFLVPTIAILNLPRFTCEYTLARSPDSSVNLTSLPDIGSDEHRLMWMERLREIQGAIMVSSLFQIVIGFSGLMGFVLRYIGPLAITPTMALTGMALFSTGSDIASRHWWIALMTMFFIAVFSQYSRCFKTTRSNSRGRRVMNACIKFSQLFPVLLAMILAWIICAILTAAGALPEDKDTWGYAARTDTKIVVLQKSKWFRAPYPGQWGLPTVSIAGVFGMLGGVLASMIESVGDYYACARLSGAPPPPISAINRGIGVEGIGCLLAGAWGSGNGTTSYSENVGAIGITKVGSRRVVQVGGCLMIVLGCLGKFAALFATIPDPVIGGMFMVMFGMVSAVGLSNLQYVDLNSSRNIFILGVSMFFGLSFPVWLQSNDVINTGNDIVDQIISVLFGTSMFVGGLVGFVLDNTIPGTDEERGLLKWREDAGAVGGDSDELANVYTIPRIQKYFNNLRISKYLPFCPNFNPTSGESQTHSDDAPQKIDTAFNNPCVVQKGDSVVTRL